MALTPIKDMHLITTIPQIDGGTRELYAATVKDAREARSELRRDRAMIDAISPAAIVDVERDGTRRRVR